tara:strand:+ start:635 stop:1279 length:645 start_codon:yes stop_codon:yes gene_type:complete
MKISIILDDKTNRSSYYLKEIVKNKIELEDIVLYNKKNKSNIINFLKNKTSYKKKLIISHCKNINEKKLAILLLNLRSKNIIYSSSQIIRNKQVLKKKNMIHVHAGKIPSFRGSTTIYYSFLKNNHVECTCFVLSEKIDHGDIIGTKKFLLPLKGSDIESSYDNKIRAITLVHFLKKKKLLKYRQIKRKPSMYYIAHPIIRFLTIKKINKMKNI